MQHDILRCSGLTKSFNGNQILAPIDLVLKSGEVTGIVGPSGCGKTTILRIIADLEKPTSGTITISHTHARTAFNFQEPRLIPWHTVLQNILFVLNHTVAHNKERVQRAREALEAVELGNYLDYYPDQLSGGMKQRVSLARALAFEPDIFLMDEPFAGLDYPLRMQLITLFNRLLQERSMSVVFVSHDTREITRLCDTVYILNGSPCSIQETIRLGPKSERLIHPGYLQRMEEHMLQIMVSQRV
ncbi:MAG: ABC transporter ATP-binding protein [Sphaerochaetaceae bacterium]|nr:ABC transporter ATP-binding protein [Sphaerochaetaceae bacterium]